MLASDMSYSSPSSSALSPDTISPLYPDRPIRPLPKRRLRSRLSSDAAESLLAPLTPSKSTPLFYYPYNYEQSAPDGVTTGQPAARSRSDGYHQVPFSFRERSREEERAEEDVRVKAASEPPKDGLGSKSYARPSQPPLTSKPTSTASSVDGYDSFENTNNKKKRKIPLYGSTNAHHSHLAVDMAKMEISAAQNNSVPGNGEGGIGPYGGAYPGSAGYAGAAASSAGAVRGRRARSMGRNGTVRAPLAVSTDGSNPRVNARGSGTRTKDRHTSSGIKGARYGSARSPGVYNEYSDDPGLHAASRGGQENIDLAAHGSSKRSTPSKTQFTFTPSADVTWPGGTSAGYPYGYSGNTMPGAPTGAARAAYRRSMATQGTQTSPTGGSGGPGGWQGGSNVGHEDSDGIHGAPQARPRRPGRQYALAARQRRLQQEYSNWHNPPNPEDMWICEFCEYESIFGAPPEALVRQYEIKDRRERKKLAEKRRLLEKAKLKGRKGKKGGKGNSRNTSNNAAGQAQHGQHQQQSLDNAPLDPANQHDGGQETQFDEGLEDDFHDEYYAQGSKQGREPLSPHHDHGTLDAPNVPGDISGGHGRYRAPDIRA